ncbi:MAG: sporulation transcription factor Spo0A [Firmicutes bacterium]|nr:sporulation transcription factor Spo0A [Bacillota bacterium]
MIRVLIADNNFQLCAALSEYLNSLPDMEVVGCAYDGEETLEMIARTNPDVVILDITMPRLDGMAVLERLDDLELTRRPRIIVLTALAREDIAQRFTALGADYFVLKPFDLQLLAERIRQFAPSDADEAQPVHLPAKAPKQRPADLEARITSLLHEMGMPAHFKGYQYLRDAVLMTVEGLDLVGGSLSKEIYPRLASKYNATPGGVEAAIRNALIACWENGNRPFLEQLTGQSLRSRQGRFPTNSMIIAKLADHLRMQVRAS